MAILDRVKFDGLKSRDWVVYKYPSEKLVFGTQLIVNEGQRAIFVKGGRVCDVFEPGTFKLDTLNLPIINGIINLPYGSKTPFTAEIYFINTTTKLDVFWGTINPIQLIDPKYQIKLRIRTFGQAGLKLTDSRRFFTELIGGMPLNEIVKYEKINEFFKGIVTTKVKTIISKIIINDKISALEITPQLESISEKVKESLEDEFEKYGVSLVNFLINSINFPEEDFDNINRILEEKAVFEIMGDSRYSVKRSFDVYESAAKNENGMAGSMVAGGIGLGAGVNLMNNINETVSKPSKEAAFIQCPECHAQVPSNGKFCNECGCLIKKARIICNKCGTENQANAKFCSGCGNNLQTKKCTCGFELQQDTRFCPECGKKVEE